MWAGWASSLVGIAITSGEMVGGAAVKPLGHMKIQAICVMVCTFVRLLRWRLERRTCTDDTPNRSLQLSSLAVSVTTHHHSDLC